ncbi:MAG TPA: universal stress protein, partial [Candidatus Binatia bacterium]|nr:universal stress protein [Candidatus Binatia bacterium]
MGMLNKILAPTDFSELSAKGVRYASQLAKELGSELIVMNIVPLDESNFASKREIDQHKLELDEFLVDRDVKPDLNLRKLVEPGVPSGAIISFAERENCDLIVMSSHGRSGLSRLLVGSVTEQILRKSPCPVLV